MPTGNEPAKFGLLKPSTPTVAGTNLKKQTISRRKLDLKVNFKKNGEVKCKSVGILDLPERVRVKILKYLTYEERAAAQYVCRQFRNEIRMRVGLQSRITDTSRHGLVFMRDVIVDTITVGRFMEPSLTPTQIIGNPDKVKNLIFEEPISIAQLDVFLSRCLRLESIVVAAAPFESLMIMSPAPSSARPKSAVLDSLRTWDIISKTPFLLDRLQSLSLILPGRKSIFFFQKLLTVIDCPNLENLSLRIGNEADRVDSRVIHTRILHFLKKYKRLSDLFICTMPALCDSKFPDSVNFIGFPKSEILAVSEELQLNSIVLTESADIYQIWTIFLSVQRHLQVFQVMQHISLKTLSPIVKRNTTTLRKVGIHLQLRQKEGHHIPINMELFKDCCVLEELMIDLSMDIANARGDAQNSRVPNVILLRELPQSLRVLSLRDCAFLTLDLLQMRKEHRKLQSLGLVCMKGLLPGFGVNYRSLLQLMRYPALNELLVTEIRANEKDKQGLRKMKKVLESGLKLNRTGIYIGHEQADKCRWIIGPNSSCLFRFASTWGVSGAS